MNPATPRDMRRGGGGERPLDSMTACRATGVAGATNVAPPGFSGENATCWGGFPGSRPIPIATKRGYRSFRAIFRPGEEAYPETQVRLWIC